MSYIIGKKDFLSPWFILCFMFLTCLLVTLFNMSNWDVNYTYKGTIYLVVGIGSWGIGSIIAKGCHMHVKVCDKHICCLHCKQYPAEWVGCISVILLALYWYKMMHFSGGYINVFKVLRVIYDKTVEGNSLGFITNQIFIINGTLAYISIYQILKKRPNKKKLLVYILPIGCYGLCMLISTDRNTFLRFFIYTGCLFVLKSREKIKKNVNIKIIKKTVPLVMIGVIAFFLMGKAKNYQSNFGRAISIYCGSGIYAFNLLVSSWGKKTHLYGMSTFYTVFEILKKFGVPFGDLSQYRFENFISYTAKGGEYFSTNVYTALKRYFEDFGVGGIIIIPMITGFIYELFYKYVKRSEKDLPKIYYAMLIYPVVYYPIMEQLCTRLHLGTVYEVVWMYIMFNIFCRNSNKKKVIQL